MINYFNKLCVWSLLSVGIVAFGPHLQASDHQSPRTASLGGAGHAGPMLADAVFLNPSYISFLPTYATSINYEFYSNAQAPAPSPRGREYSVMIQDGRSELFQAGAAFTQREDGTFVHLGASKSIIKEFGVGLAGKYFFNNLIRKAGQDASISSTYIFSNDIQASIIVDNLLETTTGKEWGLYREFILGTKYNLQGIVLFYIDPHYTPNMDGNRYGFEAGVEFVMFDDFLLRTGFMRNATIPITTTRGRAFGLGLGWLGPRVSFDYALQRIVYPYTANAHNFGVTIYF